MFHFNTSGKQSLLSARIIIFPFFLFIYADSILSYYYPVVVETTIHNNFFLGLIMASSSLVGIICDFAFPIIFNKKQWQFFIISASLIAFLFPISIFLGIQNTSLFFFVLAAAVWGVYFELYNFGLQAYAVSSDRTHKYTRFWSIMSILWGISTVIAPILGSRLLNLTPIFSILTIVSIQAISTFILIVVVKTIPQPSQAEKHVKIRSKIGIITEYKYWRLLLPHIWPAIVLSIVYYTIDSVYWTFGGIIGESLFSNLGIGWIIITLFSLPEITNSLIIAKWAPQKHKKLYAQFSMAVATFLMIFFMFAENKFLLLTLILLSGGFFANVYILNNSVFSDLERRAGLFDIQINALSRSTASIGFIIGPLLSGFLADKFGYLHTFSILGAVFFLVVLFLLFKTKRKLNLPQHELMSMFTDKNSVV